MKVEITEGLTRIAGAEQVIRDQDKLSAYFRGPVPQVPLVAVTPKDADEVVELVKLATREAVPLFTLKDTHFPEPFPESGGVIVDFKRMNAIEGVDKRNLTAHIQRGVTWDQLGEELGRQGLKTLMPAAASSSCMDRGITPKSSNQGRESNMPSSLSQPPCHHHGWARTSTAGCAARNTFCR